MSGSRKPLSLHWPSVRLKLAAYEGLKVKLWGLASGTVCLQTMILPPPVLVKVQETSSPGSRSIVAVRLPVLVVVPLSGSVQTRPVSVQPAGGPSSMTVQEPVAWTSGPLVLGRVPSASSSREKAVKQVPEKKKSWACRCPSGRSWRHSWGRTRSSAGRCWGW